MTITGWNPETIAAPIGPFRHVVQVPANTQLAFISGQIGQDASGQLVQGGCAAQTLQTFTNLERALESLSASPQDIVKLFTIVAGEGSFQAFSSTRAQVFRRWYPNSDFPAHSAFTAAELASPEILVEIEAIVAVPQ